MVWRYISNLQWTFLKVKSKQKRFARNMEPASVLRDATTQVESTGFALLADVFSPAECSTWAADFNGLLTNCPDPATSLRRHTGAIYGARNLLEIFPASQTLWRREPLISLMTTILGPGFGLVRGLFFDKSPESNWSLPWHQDLTIAVQDNSLLPSPHFKNPTRKAGVPHVEAPREILEQMLTLRLHLDDVTADNGPLRVLAGSHRQDAPPDKDQETTILAKAGDVLAMPRFFITPAARPLPPRSSIAASSTWNSPAAGNCRTGISGGTSLRQHLADEFLGAGRLRVIDDLLRGSFLGYFPVRQQKDPVGTPAGEEDFVRDHDQGQAVLFEVFERAQNFHFELRVEGTGDFVAQQAAGLHGKSPGDGHPLLLPAGELLGVIVSPLRQADALQQIAGFFRRGPFRRAFAPASVLP